MDEFMLYLPNILVSMAVYLVAHLSPGPNIIAIISTSTSAGRLCGSRLALGLALGSFLWVLISVLGVASVIYSSACILIILSTVGGIYLLWLGCKSLRSSVFPKERISIQVTGEQPGGAYILRGIIVQMTNPKSGLAMAAIVSIGMQRQAPFWVGAVLVAGISLLSLVGHLTLAFIFSTGAVVSMYFKIRRMVEAVLGVMFFVAGIKLLSQWSS